MTVLMRAKPRVLIQQVVGRGCCPLQICQGHDRANAGRRMLVIHRRGLLGMPHLAANGKLHVCRSHANAARAPSDPRDGQHESCEIGMSSRYPCGS